MALDRAAVAAIGAYRAVVDALGDSRDFATVIYTTRTMRKVAEALSGVVDEQRSVILAAGGGATAEPADGDCACGTGDDPACGGTMGTGNVYADDVETLVDAARAKLGSRLRFADEGGPS
ncbi:MAG TPA: hypothetical protein VK659_08470 [Asanoa sp.]|nr:hypothetical protein [Asanoa sp.]